MYRLLHPTQPNSGMFAFIWQTIRAMYHYPNERYYVWFGRESCYFDEQMYEEQGVDNVWDYYFEQPHIQHFPSQEEISSEVGILHDEFSEFRDLYLDTDTYDKRRIEYSDIIQKHVRLLPHVSEKILSYQKENFSGNKILGVHCRGTDHPDKLDMDYYVKKIDPQIKDYDRIFVASDEQSRVDALKSAFGEMIIEYPVTFRSLNESPLHYHNNYQVSKYYVGEDVIIEAYLLSMVDKLVCCTGSNVNHYVRALNTNLPYSYL